MFNEDPARQSRSKRTQISPARQQVSKVYPVTWDGPKVILYEKGIELKPFWQRSLLHRFFNVTSKEILRSQLYCQKGFNSTLCAYKIATSSRLALRKAKSAVITRSRPAEEGHVRRRVLYHYRCVQKTVLSTPCMDVNSQLAPRRDWRCGMPRAPLRVTPAR